MVKLTKIYTRTGDDGTTALGDMSRVSKNDQRLVAYADVDEANSAIGVVVATPGLDVGLAALLTRIQNDLFDVGADLCTPVVENPEYPPLRVEQEYVDRLLTFGFVVLAGAALALTIAAPLLVIGVLFGVLLITGTTIREVPATLRDMFSTRWRASTAARPKPSPMARRRCSR